MTPTNETDLCVHLVQCWKLNSRIPTQAQMIRSGFYVNSNLLLRLEKLGYLVTYKIGGKVEIMFLCQRCFETSRKVGAAL